MRITRSLCSSILVALLALLASQPVRAQHQTPGWAYPVMGTGAVLVGFALDQAVRDAIVSGYASPLETFAVVGHEMGHPAVLAAAVATMHGAGVLLDRPDISTSALHTSAALAATVVSTGALKVMGGRSRPDVAGSYEPEQDPHQWNWFSLKNFTQNSLQSFPSGHTSLAFALARAVQVESQNTPLAIAAYSGATLIGASRILYDRHWVSDVTAGAVVGMLSAEAALRFMHRNEHARVSISPAGVQVTIPTR